MGSVQIEIPYEGDQPLILDDAARNAKLGLELHWLWEHAEEHGVPRIITSTAILFAAEVGTIAECLRTAIIWERG